MPSFKDNLKNWKILPLMGKTDRDSIQLRITTIYYGPDVNPMGDRVGIAVYMGGDKKAYTEVCLEDFKFIPNPRELFDRILDALTRQLPPVVGTKEQVEKLLKEHLSKALLERRIYPTRGQIETMQMTKEAAEESQRQIALAKERRKATEKRLKDEVTSAYGKLLGLNFEQKD